MFLDDLEPGLEEEDDDRSISEEEPELNYNYTVTFNALFEKTNIVC